MGTPHNSATFINLGWDPFSRGLEISEPFVNPRPQKKAHPHPHPRGGGMSGSPKWYKETLQSDDDSVEQYGRVKVTVWSKSSEREYGLKVTSLRDCME